MNYVSKNDFYEIRVASLITNLDRDSLLELYQPIIGAKATSLYLTLSTQNKTNGDSILKVEQLLKSMQLRADEFFDARRYLEAVGLIKTFESVQEDVRFYIYEIFSPKSPKAFFEDTLFKGLFFITLGEKEARRVANKWKVNLNLPKEYKEVSASFVDVYKVDFDDPSFNKEFKIQILGRDHGRAQLGFNFDLFLSYIKDSSGINTEIFSSKDLKEISRIATLFGIDEKWMASIIIDEYNPTSDPHFDFYKVKKNCEDLIKHSVLKPTKNEKVSGDTILAKKVALFEVSPVRYLKFKQENTKPSSSDINILNTLSKDYGFNNGVVNVIVDYVLEKNNNVLSKNYCEKIAASLAREGVTTTVDAMNYLKKLTVKSPKKKVTSTKLEKEEGDMEISMDEMIDLLNDLEVKKNGK